MLRLRAGELQACQHLSFQLPLILHLYLLLSRERRQGLRTIAGLRHPQTHLCRRQRRRTRQAVQATLRRQEGRGPLTQGQRVPLLSRCFRQGLWLGLLSAVERSLARAIGLGSARRLGLRQRLDTASLAPLVSQDVRRPRAGSHGPIPQRPPQAQQRRARSSARRRGHRDRGRQAQ